MDAATLAAVMGNRAGVPYASYVDAFNLTLIQANCTTVNRVAMFCAQTGEESGGLLWTQELGSGAEYNNRPDLGNTRPGDGQLFKGRGILQVTGRNHYAEFGAWCFHQGLVGRPDYFLVNPVALASPPWSFLSAAWYWTVERPDLNAVSDRGDYVTATHRVNGGENGLADRKARWNRALTFGTRLLPDGGDDLASVPQSEWNDVHAALTALLKPWPGGVSDKEPSKLEDPNAAGYNLFQYVLRNNVELHRTRAELAELRKIVDRLVAKP